MRQIYFQPCTFTQLYSHTKIINDCNPVINDSKPGNAYNCTMTNHKLKWAY